MCTSNEIKLHLEVEIKLLCFKGKGFSSYFIGLGLVFFILGLGFSYENFRARTNF